MDRIDFFRTAIERGASDIIILPGAPPMARIDGNVIPIFPNLPDFTPELSQAFVYSFLSERQRSKFEANLELDCSFTIADVARFRANIFRQKNGISAVYRIIPPKVPSPQEIGLTPEMVALTDLPGGLIIITGPQGVGKSTTMASLIELINLKYRKNIITIEDPVEFIYERKQSVIHQREVGEDTPSFQSALRNALRESPDIILIGELRDYETIQLAVTAAETGHLCLTTLHTYDCASAVSRIVDVCPAEQQNQIRIQLSFTLQAVIAQMLLPRADGKGRVAAREFMVQTSAISSGIRDNHPNVLYSAMQTGKKQGMHTMDQDLARLVASGVVRGEDVIGKVRSPNEFPRLLGETSGQR